MKKVKKEFLVRTHKDYSYEIPGMFPGVSIIVKYESKYKYKGIMHNGLFTTKVTIPKSICFTNTKKLLISFSGGRTSAYMLYYLWFQWPERDKWEKVVVFANTGLEHPGTLLFVHRCSLKWSIPIIWVEGSYKDESGELYSPKGWSVRHKEVDYYSASRATKLISGGWSWTPFEELISILGIPSTNTPFCSDQMKRKVIESYLDELGWTDYQKAIGIRADEIDRINSKHIKLGIIYPLIKNEIKKEDVISWWGEQNFNLEIPEDLGNCKVCWKKDLKRLCRIALDYNRELDWWKYITEKYGHLNPRETKLKPPFNFYRGNLSPWNIEKLALNNDEEEIKQLSRFEKLDGCSESCEVF